MKGLQTSLRKVKGVVTSALLLSPFLTLAAGHIGGPRSGSGAGGVTPDLSWLDQLVKGVGTIVDSLIPVVFALILLAFFWGLAKFVFGVGKEGKDEGKNIMLWSVIALFVAASIWGIVNVMQGLFGITDKGGQQEAPSVPGL